ncbi:MAG: enoyl-CoA hydratase [Dehalococcoidia bacterium]|nr:enoyl-CoA hydratase [Dehalococcoidia bacterium]
MPKSLTLYEVRNGIAVLTLNNPRRRNALSFAMMDEMLGHLENAESDGEVRVVVIRAEGPVFSSGHDLRELAEGDMEDQTILFARCTELMEAVRLLPKPVIVQVQGLATAAGCQLVATCDLAVASEEAGFATPGVDIGLFCTTPAVAVGRALPLKKTMEMLLTGQPIPASDALDAGLVNKVVSGERLEVETMALAEKVASAPTSTVSIGKSAFYRQMAMDRPQAYELAQRVMVENLQSADAKEGIGAFLEKREPRWQS